MDETLQRIMGQTNNDCRFQIFISTNSQHPATFACWKMRFKTEVCTCSPIHHGSYALDQSSRRGIQMPNFEVLDARISSALNRIIHNSHFKRRISLEEQKTQKQDRFLRGRQIASLDLLILPGHWSQRFCRELCRPIHYWSSKWPYSGIRFKVGQKLVINDKDSAWWYLGRIVQI